MKHLSAIVPLVRCWPALHAAGGQPTRVEFARDVRPILERSCWKCHGPDKQKGGVRFDRRQGAIAAGDSGKTAVRPRRAAESELIRRVEAGNADERMPPGGETRRRGQVKVLRAWSDNGRDWPETG